jgi:glutathione S-transferase
MAKLFHSPASPYARKVRIAAAEKQVALELVAVSLSPVSRNDDVARHNPLGKVPCLVTPDGVALFDSRVICAWIDAQGSAPRLIPDGAARWPVLALEALADGVLDAALLHRYEHNLRPEPLRWQDWADGQWAKITAALDQLERTAPGWSGVDLGLIAVGAALGYLDFRFADRPWRATRPRLAAWFEGFAARPSVAATVPA